MSTLEALFYEKVRLVAKKNIGKLYDKPHLLFVPKE